MRSGNRRGQSLDDADLIVDALLGTGLRGPVEGLLGAVISDVNAAPGQERRQRRQNLRGRRGYSLGSGLRRAGQ